MIGIWIWDFARAGAHLHHKWSFARITVLIHIVSAEELIKESEHDEWDQWSSHPVELYARAHPFNSKIWAECGSSSTLKLHFTGIAWARVQFRLSQRALKSWAALDFLRNGNRLYDANSPHTLCLCPRRRCIISKEWWNVIFNPIELNHWRAYYSRVSR